MKGVRALCRLGMETHSSPRVAWPALRLASLTLVLQSGPCYCVFQIYIYMIYICLGACTLPVGIETPCSETDSLALTMLSGLVVLSD